MATFTYRALNERGRAIHGQLTAGNERELLSSFAGKQP